MFESIKAFEFNSQLAIFIYWIPMTICLVVYFIRFIIMYRQDVAASSSEKYVPQLTLGYIAIKCIGSITPALNLFMFVFDAAASMFKFIGKVLDIPLVPKRKQ